MKNIKPDLLDQLEYRDTQVLISEEINEFGEFLNPSLLDEISSYLFPNNYIRYIIRFFLKILLEISPRLGIDIVISLNRFRDQKKTNKDFLRALLLAQKLLEKNIVSEIHRNLNFNDAPRLISYAAQIVNPEKKEQQFWGSGSSFFSKEHAFWAAIGESVERYSLLNNVSENYKRGRIIRCSFNELKRKGVSALNPLFIVAFTEKQRADFPERFKISEDSTFFWQKGFSLTRKKAVYVPSQLYSMYIPEGEQIIRPYVTTGAAASQCSIDEAIYRGICETIERDAIMIRYLNQLPAASVVNLQSIDDQRLLKILNDFRRYNLELNVLDITLDTPLPVFLAIVKDRTGIGPALSVGAKAGEDVAKTFLGCVTEAFSSWVSIRRKLHHHPEWLASTPPVVVSRDDRLFYWSRTDMIGKLDFLLKTEVKSDLIEDYPEIAQVAQIPIPKKIEWLINKLKERGQEIIYVDIAPPEIKKLGFFAVQIIIPGFQPLHLLENYPFLGGKRLREIPAILDYKNKGGENFNLIPHPFP